MIYPKLKGIPHIYYINLEKDNIRKEWMESQFHQLGIQNFTRINASNFLKEEFSQWSGDTLHHPEIYREIHYRSVSISVIGEPSTVVIEPFLYLFFLSIT